MNDADDNCFGLCIAGSAVFSSDAVVIVSRHNYRTVICTERL